MGIGESVSGFQGFLSKADDIDVLREGLVNVTSGLGTAFDTTFLALLISVIVVFPLTFTERAEQRLLTKIDLFLRKVVLEGLPDSTGSGTIDKTVIEKSINNAFEKFLPGPEALVEPAKEYAMRAASLLTEQLAPLKTIGDEAILCMQDARASTKAQADEISFQLENISKTIGSSIESLEPALRAVQQLSASSEELKEELERLRAGEQLNNTFKQLELTLNNMVGVLRESRKPRKVVLVEQVIE